MENSEINRTMFFAQYLFQPILMAKISDLPLVLNTTTLNDYHDGDYLKLKPLSSITDEDAIEIAKLYGWENASSIEFIDIVLQFKIDLPCIVMTGYSHKHLHFVFDYLRSKGYALPYMGLPVEQLIEYGWIKL